MIDFTDIKKTENCFLKKYTYPLARKLQVRPQTETFL